MIRYCSLLMLALLLALPIASSATLSQKTLGDENAPVTLEKFSDFECPFCKRWYDQTSPRIIEEFVENGDVKIVYKHFPLSFHPRGIPAAIASECAAEQDVFFEYIDFLYAGKLSDSQLIENAKSLKLDIDVFEDCMADPDVLELVQKNIEEGELRGVRGTPAFFVNDLMVSGAQPYSAFEEAILQELKNPTIDYDLLSDNSGDLDDLPDSDEPLCASGCIVGDSCIPFGHRLNEGGMDVYCDISGSLVDQKQDDLTCQNNYECLSNQCSNGNCINLQKELDETQSLLKRLIGWFKGIFG